MTGTFLPKYHGPRPDTLFYTLPVRDLDGKVVERSSGENLNKIIGRIDNRRDRSCSDATVIHRDVSLLDGRDFGFVFETCANDWKVPEESTLDASVAFDAFSIDAGRKIEVHLKIENNVFVTVFSLPSYGSNDHEAVLVAKEASFCKGMSDARETIPVCLRHAYEQYMFESQFRDSRGYIPDEKTVKSILIRDFSADKIPIVSSRWN